MVFGTSNTSFPLVLSVPGSFSFSLAALTRTSAEDVSVSGNEIASRIA